MYLNLSHLSADWLVGSNFELIEEEKTAISKELGVEISVSGGYELSIEETVIEIEFFQGSDEEEAKKCTKIFRLMKEKCMRRGVTNC